MDDFISRAKTIQVMMDEDVDHVQGTSGREVIQILMDVEPAQQWIPCSERMPESGKAVLVTSTTGRCYVWFVHPYREDDYMWEDEEGYLRDKHDAVAWMPLPEPWTGGEQDEG